MTTLDSRLLKDLARLAQRYPPEQWSLLVDWVSDERNQRKLTQLLHEMMEVSQAVRRRPAPARAASGRTRTLRTTIEEMRDEDPARSAMLEALWDKLRAREVLPTMASIRSFVAEAGLSDLNSSRREQAVTEIMEQLVALPRNDLEKVALTPATEDRDLRAEYERWVRLILDRKPDAGP
jgi:hypothetical protein